MKKTGTTAWDAATHLESVEDMAAYLEAAFEDGDPALIAAALGDVARAQGMTQVVGTRASAARASTRPSPPKATRSSPP